MITITHIFWAFAVSIIPAALWWMIIRHRQHKGYLSRFIIIFLLAGVGAMLFFDLGDDLRRLLINTLDMPLLLAYFLIGALIEYSKNILVRLTGWGWSKSVDDVIALSFAAALGFVIFANFFQFLLAFSGQLEGVNGYVGIVKFVLLREFFVLPVHLFCSGIFGYYYGVAKFATPELRKIDLVWVQKILFFLPLKKRHATASILRGTLISVTFYAVFYTIFQLNPTAKDLFELLGLWHDTVILNERIVVIFSFLFSTISTTIFFLLMDKKRQLVRQKLLKGEARQQ